MLKRGRGKLIFHNRLTQQLHTRQAFRLSSGVVMDGSRSGIIRRVVVHLLQKSLRRIKLFPPYKRNSSLINAFKKPIFGKPHHDFLMHNWQLSLMTNDGHALNT